MSAPAFLSRLHASLAPLRGKVVRLEIRGLGGGPQFRLGALGPLPDFSSRADVTIRASLADFVALALRREDPDSLFFARRLVIEGDTALGLQVKNALDSLALRA